MKRIVLLLFVLLAACSLKAQEQSEPKDSIILRRFFHTIGRCCKNTNQSAKKVAYNATIKYHDAPGAANVFDKRFSISLNAGGNYNADFEKKHFPLDTGQFIIERETNYSTSSYYPNVSYTHIPEFGFQGGLICAFQITKTFSVEGGLMYFSRRSKDLYSTDTSEINILEKFTEWSNPPYTYYKEIEKNTHNLEVPFYFCYSYKGFSLLIGTRLKLLSVQHERNTLIDNTIKKSKVIRHPFDYRTRAVDNSIPSFKLRYQVNQKKVSVSLYLSADWIDNKEWDLSAGVQLGIFSK